jgi:ABC-type uncharacterized transport system permease subunit
VKKLFAVDLKRLLNNKMAILFAVGAPLLLVLLISFAVAPYFYADVRAENFTVAVYNEDEDPLTQSILRGLIESRSLGGLISVEFVQSEDEGRSAVEEGAAAFIHIPAGMQDTLYNNGRCTISYYGNPKMPLEDALLFETLDSGISLVSNAQHAINVLYHNSLDAGVDEAAAADAYNRTRIAYFSSILARSALYEETDTTSPLGGALPIEYYAVSFLVLFVALGGLPIARMTADDGETGLIHRQLLSGHAPIACVMSRWLAGSLFLLLQYIVLAIALSLIAGGSAFSGNLIAVISGGVLLCLFLSLVMMLTGLLSKTAAFAVRAAFLCVLALALLGGLLVPSAYMPAIVRDVSYVTPFSAALRLNIAALFNGKAEGLYLFAGILAAYTAVLLPMVLRRFQRRTQ